jgi:predicted AlkP superfamily pyrophosphatase or phosphodiesterase
MIMPIATAFAIASLLSTARSLTQWGPEQWDHGFDCHEAPFKNVWGVSIDGLHSGDIEKWLAYKPVSNIIALLKTGYEYSNALTIAPSDSFPATCAFYAGATPKTTGIWYDDTYNCAFYAPKDMTCTGLPGAESQCSRVRVPATC